MKPFPDHVIEWITKQSNAYSFELNKHCVRCGEIKPIVSLTPSGRWACGECWAKFFTWPDPIKQ